MSSTRTIIIIVIILALIVGGYLFFVRGGSSSNDTLTRTGVTGGVTMTSQEFLIKLQELQAIEFNTSFFDDPRFASLRDFTQAIGDEQSGRSNPFAPVQ